MELRKIHQPQPRETETIERRFAPAGLEIRQADNGTATLKGYALRFGSVYDMGWFTEEVSATALSAADISDVRILLNHDPNNILGRTSANTARVGVDTIGLWYEVDLPDSPNGQNARVAVERGDITQSSWGFSLRRDETGRRIGDKWEMRDGKEHRILTDVDIVFDASPVTFPANPDTTIAKRSRDEFAGIEQKQAAEIEEEKEVRDMDSWELGWVVDNVAWATYRGNEMVSALNGWINNYRSHANHEGELSAVFAGLEAQCMATKAALIELINVHADAIKSLNASDSRGVETQEQETKTLSNSDLLLLELQLKEAEIRAKKMKYDYEKICN